MIDEKGMAKIRRHVAESAAIVYGGDWVWPSNRKMHERYLQDVKPLLIERDELTERVQRDEAIGGYAYSPLPSERPVQEHPINHVYGSAVVHYKGPDGPRIAIHYRQEKGDQVMWVDHHGEADSMRRLYPDFFRAEANEWPTNWDPWPEPERTDVKGPNRRWIIHRARNGPRKLRRFATWVGLKLGRVR
jgi:hypothetical protein